MGHPIKGVSRPEFDADSKFKNSRTVTSPKLKLERVTCYYYARLRHVKTPIAPIMDNPNK